jgi:hypothetical protein
VGYTESADFALNVFESCGQFFVDCGGEGKRHAEIVRIAQADAFASIVDA